MLSTLIQSAYNSIQDPILLVHPDTSDILFTNEYFHTLFGKQRVKFKDLFPLIELPFKDKTTMIVGSSKISVEISTGTLAQVTLKTETAPLAHISRYEAEYQELQKIGSGGFGAVYKARNLLDGQEYAIKKGDLISNEWDSDSFSSFPDTCTNRRRFSIQDNKLVREVQTLASVSNHSHIVRYYNAWIETTIKPSVIDEDELDDEMKPCVAILYIQMQLYDCNTLRQWLDERNDIDMDENLKLFMQIVDALVHIHSQGVVHRDIKPANIFMKNGHVHVGDFGLAKRGSGTVVSIQDVDFESHTTETGTFFYSPPEANVFFTPKSDVYALGIILFEMFTNYKTGMERCIHLTKLKESQWIPMELKQNYPFVSELILSLTKKDAESRPHVSDIVHHPIFNRALSAGGRIHDYQCNPFECGTEIIPMIRSKSLPATKVPMIDEKESSVHILSKRSSSRKRFSSHVPLVCGNLNHSLENQTLTSC